MAAVNASVGLRHPNIVALLGATHRAEGDCLTVDIASEFVGGQPLDAVLRAGGRMDESKAACVAAELLDGLAFLHDHDIVHAELTVATVVVDAMV